MKSKAKVAVHCIMCGKNFQVGDKAECGGIYSGKPMCKSSDIQRYLDKDKTPSNAAVTSGEREA